MMFGNKCLGLGLFQFALKFFNMFNLAGRGSRRRSRSRETCVTGTNSGKPRLAPRCPLVPIDSLFEFVELSSSRLTLSSSSWNSPLNVV